MEGGVNGTDKPGLGLRLGSGLIWAVWLLFTAMWTPSLLGRKHVQTRGEDPHRPQSLVDLPNRGIAPGW